MKTLPTLLLTAALTACVTVADPTAGYKGPVVSVRDTGKSLEDAKAEFFVLASVDGQSIADSVSQTRAASQGKGNTLELRMAQRFVPAKPMKVQLIGTHFVPMPIREIAGRTAGTFFSVSGEVAFTPQPGKAYEVLGVLDKAQSCVWIADAWTQEVVTEKVCTKR